MANKRQRKKQQAKKNISELKRVGINNKKEIKHLKNKPDKVKKIVKKETRKIVANERSQIIKSFGYKVSDHSSKRYWSEKRFSEWVKNEYKKREQAKRRHQRKIESESDPYLIIFWKEKTDAYLDSQEIINKFKKEYKYMTIPFLIESIKTFLTNRLPALIGTSMVVHTTVGQADKLKRFYLNYDTGFLSDWNTWGIAYEGKAIRYKELLLGINTVVRLLYDDSDKASFISDIFNKLGYVNPKIGKRLAKDLGWRGF